MPCLPCSAVKLKGRSSPAACLKYQTRTSPCESACPAGNPIQKVHGLVKEKRYEEALEFLRARNPFPGTTGRICTHPCETDCNRREWDEAINIRGLERAAADAADRTRVKKPMRMERSGKKIAVIGGGPAGLTFAYFSSLLGHEVTVFEAGPTLGGVPRLCVPEYRLPKDILDMEIGLVLETGVKARTNTRIGREISFAEVRASYDAVLIAAGAWKERKLDLPHADKVNQRGRIPETRQSRIHPGDRTQRWSSSAAAASPSTAPSPPEGSAPKRCISSAWKGPTAWWPPRTTWSRRGRRGS